MRAPPYAAIIPSSMHCVCVSSMAPLACTRSCAAYKRANARPPLSASVAVGSTDWIWVRSTVVDVDAVDDVEVVDVVVAPLPLPPPEPPLHASAPTANAP